jgi:hypothetical protein
MASGNSGQTRIAGLIHAAGLCALCLLLAGAARAYPPLVAPQTVVQAGRLALQAQGMDSPTAPGQVIRLLSVGSVLTADGTIWQYVPDRQRWLTIDESFRLQKKETHILPLPVPAPSIREMVTFGFLLTEIGDCWLYNMGTGRWEKLPAPGR